MHSVSKRTKQKKLSKAQGNISMLPINNSIYNKKRRLVLTVQKITLPEVRLPFRLEIADGCFKIYFNVAV